MPVKKVKGGYRWGSSGKVYPTRAQAENQGRAIRASGYKERKSPSRKMGNRNRVQVRKNNY